MAIKGIEKIKFSMLIIDQISTLYIIYLAGNNS